MPVNQGAYKEGAWRDIRKTAGLETFSSPWANPRHSHNGADSPLIPFDSIGGKQFIITTRVQGTSAATAGNYGMFFISPFAFSVQTMIEFHRQDGSVGGTVAVLVGAVTPVLAGGDSYTLESFPLNSGQLAPHVSTINPETAPPVFPPGSGIFLDTVGTLTDVEDVMMTVLCNYENSPIE